MHNRIKEVRKATNLTLKVFGEKIGLGASSVQRVEAGIYNPSEQTIRAICTVFNVDRHWLETGEGEMFAPDRSVTLDRISSRYSSSEAFRAMLDVYSQLEPAHQDVIEAYILQLADAIAAGRRPESVAPDLSSLDRLAAERAVPYEDDFTESV